MSSHKYLDGMLQSVQEAYPNLLDTQVLKALFPSLFLALVARDTNIVIHTSQPVELQKSTAKILSTIFGLQTKRVKIRSPQSPGNLIESFFISTSQGSFSTSSKRKPSRSSLPRSKSATRPSSSHFTEGSDSTAPPPNVSRIPRYKTDPLLQNGDSLPSHLPQVVVISNLERTSRASQLALAEALRTRRITLDTVAWNLPESFFIVYVSPVGDGYERPAIHTTLLDHFAFSITPAAAQTSGAQTSGAQTSASILTSSPSPRILPLPITPPPWKPPLFPYNRLPSLETTYISPYISHYINALLTAARHHPELDGTFLTVRCVKDAEKLVQASALVFREDKEMTISEAHVRRVVPPILAHRLRVRDDPRDQIMGILWEKAGVQNWGKPAVEIQQARKTIRAILAEILAEV